MNIPDEETSYEPGLNPPVTPAHNRRRQLSATDPIPLARFDHSLLYKHPSILTFSRTTQTLFHRRITPSSSELNRSCGSILHARPVSANGLRKLRESEVDARVASEGSYEQPDERGTQTPAAFGLQRGRRRARPRRD